MKNHHLLSQLARCVSASVLVVLTACGGGGEEASVQTAPSQATATAASTVCGQVPAAQQGPEAFNVLANQTLLVNGANVQMTLLTSPTGYSFAGVPVTMNLPLFDLREVALHGYPASDNGDSMGVESGSLFAPGSVSCVTGVSRVFDVGGSQLVSWTSQNIPSLPIELLTSTAINGFEYTHNFASTNATAVFRISKAAMSNPSAATICHIVSSGSVNCSAADWSESSDGLRWELRRSLVESGVYMLTAPPETLV